MLDLSPLHMTFNIFVSHEFIHSVDSVQMGLAFLLYSFDSFVLHEHWRAQWLKAFKCLRTRSLVLTWDRFIGGRARSAHRHPGLVYWWRPLESSRSVPQLLGSAIRPWNSFFLTHKGQMLRNICYSLVEACYYAFVLHLSFINSNKRCDGFLTLQWKNQSPLRPKNSTLLIQPVCI